MQIDNFHSGVNYWFMIQNVKQKFRDVSQFELTIISLVGYKALKVSTIELLTGRSNLRAKLERLSIHGRIDIVRHSNRAIWYRLSDTGREVFRALEQEYSTRLERYNMSRAEEQVKQL